MTEPIKCGSSQYSRDNHCWHVRSSTTDGMGMSGHDSERCCYCDAERIRPWKVERDMAHGPYYLVTKVIYEDGQ